MGTYHIIKENSKSIVVCKLGTKEHMYYVRKEEALIICLFENDPTNKLMLMDESLIWRFRWPDEDVVIDYFDEEAFKESYEKIVNAISNRNPRCLSFKVKVEQFVYEHGGNCLSGEKLKLIGDRYSPISGFRTIFSCANCNKLCSFSKREVEQLIEPALLSLNASDYPKSFLEKVVERIYPYAL